MQVETVGGDDPVLSVVGAVHGDEPCGAAAVAALRANPPDVAVPVQLVLANELARERGVRAVDDDLNRVFPGDPDAESHERRLAAELLAALRGTAVLDLHATVSHPDPFAVAAGRSPTAAWLASAAGVETLAVLDPEQVGGSLAGALPGVAIECGLKGTDPAAANAERVARNVLGALDDGAVPLAAATATGSAGDDDALAGLPSSGSDPTVYRVTGRVQGSGWTVLGENFRRVDAGEAFARRDGEVLRADEPFYPVLMSTEGYEDLVGFRAERLGRLSSLVR